MRTKHVIASSSLPFNHHGADYHQRKVRESSTRSAHAKTRPRVNEILENVPPEARQHFIEKYLLSMLDRAPKEQSKKGAHYQRHPSAPLHPA